jgi:DNA-binding NtrC family response regulator
VAKVSISILAVDDDESFRQTLKQILQQEDYFVETAPDGLAAISILQTVPFDMVLLDINMPKASGIEVLKFVKDQHLDSEVIMLTGFGEVKTAVECMSLGAFYYITKPCAASELLVLINRALERKRLLIQNKALRLELAQHASSSSIVSHNKGFLEVLDLALRAAPTDSTVLIEGASGTGKELVANFLHSNSLRKDQPFLALNCSSIPETLIESELFGHEKGAFTDAKAAKQGLVEVANGGTLFLDEVGEIPLTVQPKLLRFLESGEFRRVGGNKNLMSDVRLLSATSKDLRKEVAAGRCREDLLYRLNVITLELPSLRKRKDDIPLLVEHFLKSHAGVKEPKKIDEKALEILMKYDWPGNVRELENVVERAEVLSPDDVIRVDDLALPMGSRPMSERLAGGAAGGVAAGSVVTLAEIQKAHVAGVLESVSWNKELAAKILGISVKTLYSKIQAYKLTKLQ